MFSTQVAIVGAGLVGTLLAILLAQRGCRVTLYEKRADPQQLAQARGRSVNLTLTERGGRALAAAACWQPALAAAVPMHGWYHHQPNYIHYQAYGQGGEAIYAIERQRLSQILHERARCCGVTIHWNAQVIDVDCEAQSAQIWQPGEQRNYRIDADAIIIADGALSELRAAFGAQTAGFACSVERVEYVYKELRISAAAVARAGWKPGVHVWSRARHTLLALPNPDGSYNVIFFAPLQGPESFMSLSSAAAAQALFQRQFADALPLMPDFTDDYTRHPESQLQTVECWPWANGKVLLIGDAAHGILPFYGQGANAGFESCRELLAAIEHHPNDWPQAFQAFQRRRKPDTDAIAVISKQAYRALHQTGTNERAMRKIVLEHKLAQALPERVKTLYGQVSFSDRRYTEILQLHRIQQNVLEQVLNWTDTTEAVVFDDMIDFVRRRLHVLSPAAASERFDK